MTRLLTLFVLCFLLVACGGKEEKAPVSDASAPVEQIFNEANALLDEGKYIAASRKFDDVERLHPYSVWAKRANLMTGFALYKGEEYDKAALALDRFIQLYPADERVDYAYYLKGLIYYDQISDVRRDQSMTELALKNLNEVIRRFPDSNYARDARLKIDLTYDHLAGREMEIGRYYINQGIYNAAIKRFRRVVEEYQTTTHTAEALYRLVECYTALGIKAEAEKNAAVLGHNYPGSEWYQDAYALVTGKEEFRTGEERGFFGRAWHSITN